MNRRTVTLREAALALGVGEATLRQHMTADGTAIELGGDETLRLVRVGRRALVPCAELARVLGEASA